MPCREPRLPFLLEPREGKRGRRAREPVVVRVAGGADRGALVFLAAVVVVVLRGRGERDGGRGGAGGAEAGLGGGAGEEGGG